MPGTLYAILVGIDKYQVPTIGELRTAVRDVEAVERAFRARLDVQRCYIVKLVTGGDGPAPTRNTILNAFADFADQHGVEMGPDDLFVFYFAGHGIEQGGEHFLLGSDSPYDRKLEKLRKGAMELTEVRDMCRQLPVGQQLIIIDACRNNPVQGTRSLDGRDLPGAVVTPDVITRGLAFAPAEAGDPVQGHEVRQAWVSACDEGQLSYEYAAAGNSWFCHNFLAVLGDEPGPEVSVSRLVERTGQRMRDRAFDELRPAFNKQVPKLVCDDAAGAVCLPWRYPSDAAAVPPPPPPPRPAATPRPAAAPDPLQAINWAAIAATASAPPPAAPVHGDEGLAQYHADLAMVERIDRDATDLRAGTHPRVRDAMADLGRRRSAVDDATDEARAVRRDLSERLAADLESRGPLLPSQIRSLVGEPRMGLAYRFLEASHQARDAEARLKAGWAAFDAGREQVLAELRARRAEAVARAEAFRRADVRRVLDQAVSDQATSGGRPGAFPQAGLLRALPDLRRRHPRVADAELILLAEDLYNGGRTAPAGRAAARAADAPGTDAVRPPRRWRDADVARWRVGTAVATATAAGARGVYLGGRDQRVRRLSPVGASAAAADDGWPIGQPVERVVACGDVVLVQTAQGRVFAGPAVGTAPAVEVVPLRGHTLLSATADGDVVVTTRGIAATAHPIDRRATPADAHWVGQPVRLAVHRGAVTSAALAGRWVASGGREGDVWSGPLPPDDASAAAAPPTAAAKAYEFGAWVTAVSLSPDARRVAVVGKRNRVDVVHADHATLAFSATVAGRFLTAVAHFDDGQLLAVGDDAGSVTVLRADDGRLVWAGPVCGDGGPATGSTGRCDVIALMPDCGGAALTAVSADGSVLTIAQRDAQP
jgi:hypothetical protein